MKKYYGNYLGIVVNGSYADPENRNRLQVWVPHVTNTLYLDWNSGENGNFSDKSIFDIQNGSLNENILSRIRNSLPWAECAAPLIGKGSTYYRNEETGQQSVNPAKSMIPDEIDLGAVPDIPLEPDPDLYDEQNKNSAPPTPNSPASYIEGDVSEKSQVINLPSSSLVIERYGAGTDRNQPISNQLKNTISKGLEGTGLIWRSTSGKGTTPKQSPNSLHISGKATDGQFLDAVTKKPLNPVTSEADKQRISNALKNLTAAGIGGIGWGVDYMGAETFHLDIGSKRTWGASRTKDSAVGWVVDARSGVQTTDLIASNEDVIEQSSPVRPNMTYTSSSPISNGGYDGTATGTYSSPDVGAKVWVFFMGGDIQKPVYFAMSLDSANYQQTYQSS